MRTRLMTASVAIGATLLAVASPGAATEPSQPAVEVLVRGAPLQGADGMVFDSHDRLYVASVPGREIVAMDPRTGRVVDRYGPDAGVQAPDDFVSGPDGSLYWTDLLTGEVGRREPDGTVTKQLVAPGMNPIAFSDDGRLFAAQAFYGNGLYELDPNLVSAPTVVIPDSGERALGLNGMDFGPDGMLYAPQPFLDRIVRIDVDTAAVTLIADGLAFPRRWTSTHAATCTRPSPTPGRSSGSIPPPSWLQNAVQVWDPESDTVVEGYEDFAVPLNAIRFQDDLVVAELATGRVVRLDAGTGERTTLAEGLFVPAGLAANDDDLWVGDWASGVVWQIVADGEVLASPVPVAGGLVQPEGLARDRDGSLLVVESGLGRVTRIDPATGATSASVRRRVVR